MPLSLRLVSKICFSIFILSWLSGCDSVGSRPQGTTTGNALISIQIQSDVATDICFDQVEFTPLIGEIQVKEIAPRFIHLSNKPQSLGEFDIRLGRYKRIQIRPSQGCEQPSSLSGNSPLLIGEDIDISIGGEITLSVLLPPQDGQGTPGRFTLEFLEHLELANDRPDVVNGTLGAQMAFLTEVEINGGGGNQSFGTVDCRAELINRSDTQSTLRVSTTGVLGQIPRECEGTSLNLSTGGSPFEKEGNFAENFGPTSPPFVSMGSEWDFCALQGVRSAFTNNGGLSCSIERVDGEWRLENDPSFGTSICNARCWRFAETLPQAKVSLHETGMGPDMEDKVTVRDADFCALTAVEFQFLGNANVQCELDRGSNGSYTLRTKTPDEYGRKCSAMCVRFSSEN